MPNRFKKRKSDGQKQVRLLDYGCGFGHSLDLCKVCEIDAVGVDIDLHRIQSCRDKELNVCRAQEISAEKKFDIIVSTSVVEHVNNLNEYFQYISDRLETGGFLRLIGLNPVIIKKEKRKGTYCLVMPLEHVNFSTARSLDILTKKYSLKRIKKKQSVSANNQTN